MASNSSQEAKRDSNDDSDDESEVLEESPCGRWLKRREEVQQRDILNIDAAYLAMDTEEGVEVVWNEVQFSGTGLIEYQEKKIQNVFDSLILLDHPNIVKLHKYWIDKNAEKPRLVFITEYMSSGSLKRFLKKTKRKLPVQSWKRWCTQILSALSYLHSCCPPIIHGNLTCNSIFIQHNGLIKIGSIALDVIHKYVKMCSKEESDCDDKIFSTVLPAVDIYAFGKCALEMAVLEISKNDDPGKNDDVINRTIESLENPLQKDFIRSCLKNALKDRPSARELMFYPVIFEVHPLKLLAAHTIIKSASYPSEQLTDEVLRLQYYQSDILAYIPRQEGKIDVTLSKTDAPKVELEEYLDGVRNGTYPLTAFSATYTPTVQSRVTSPETPEAAKSLLSSSNIPESETRRIINIMCNIKPLEENENLMMTILLRMDDRMNRQLSCKVSDIDTPTNLAEELVHHGLINREDFQMVATLIGDTLSRRHIPSRPVDTAS